MKRLALCSAVVLLAAGCGSVDYRDSTGQVDANPLCVSDPDQPHAPVSDACKREQSATWSSGRKGEPVDFGGKDD